METKHTSVSAKPVFVLITITKMGEPTNLVKLLIYVDPHMIMLQYLSLHVMAIKDVQK